MMKRILLIVLAMLLLAACAAKDTNEPEIVEDENNVTQNEPEEIEPEEEPENVEEPTEPEETPEKEEEATEETTNNETEKTPEKPKYSSVDELIDLAMEIFKAQEEKDYAFLESILSSGAELDKTTNMFMFNDIIYPHEQEFLTEKKAADIEHRYIHDEEIKSVIVGFAATDYENEYNYVIDFEFVLEDGSYKMNDMDINK